MYARPRLPDPIRAAAVRALVIVAVTLVQLMIAVFCSLAAVWLAFPMVVSTVASTVVATWAVLDVWVTRQVWRQRHGVLSEPSSVARERALARARGGVRRGHGGEAAAGAGNGAGTGAGVGAGAGTGPVTGAEARAGARAGTHKPRHTQRNRQSR